MHNRAPSEARQSKVGGADALVCAGPPGPAVANVVHSYEGPYT